MKKTRTKTAKLNSNINLAQSETNRNYWSPLTCLVEEQEKMMEEIARPIATANSESEREMKILFKQNGQVSESKQPQVGSEIEEDDIDQEVIQHVSEIENKFEKLLGEINEISQATDEKICRAEENDAAQDIVEMGPFGYLDSACTSGVVTEKDQSI